MNRKDVLAGIPFLEYARNIHHQSKPDLQRFHPLLAFRRIEMPESVTFF